MRQGVERLVLGAHQKECPNDPTTRRLDHNRSRLQSWSQMDGAQSLLKKKGAGGEEREGAPISGAVGGSVGTA